MSKTQIQYKATIDSQVPDPKEWKWTRIGDVCDFVGGGTPSKAEKAYWNGNIYWASVKDIKGDTLTSTLETITNKGLQNSSTSIAYPGELILVTRITPGKTILSKITTAINQDLKIIRPKFPTNPKFLQYYFQAIQREIVVKSSGTTVLGITLNNLNEIKVPLLPLEDQDSIVSKIEELFSELDKGIECLKLAQQQLKVYRQAVLKWAFEGRLTNENVKEGELPEGWRNVQIKEIADINPRLPNKDNIEESRVVQFIPMKLVEEIINKVHLTNVQYLKDVKKGSYTPFINKDIIFAKVTPCMENGKIAIVDNLKNGIGFGSSEFHVIRSSNSIINKYLFYFLIQNRFRHEAENAMTGAVGLRRVPKQFIEGYTIPLPTLNEQQSITIEIESRLHVGDKMEESINQSLEQVEVMKQSILKMAFEGNPV